MKLSKRVLTGCVLSLLFVVPLFASAEPSVFVNTKNFSFGSGPGGFGVATKNFSFGIGNGSGGFGFGGFGMGGCSVTICGIGQTILYIINGILVPVLFGLAFIVFLWGIAKAYIFSSGDETAVKAGHKLVLWGVVAFVVMLSLWGLVNIVASTFGLAGITAPPPPTSF